VLPRPTFGRLNSFFPSLRFYFKKLLLSFSILVIWMASKNKTNVLLDPKYNYEDPAVSWINLVMATRELNQERRQQMINQLLFTAKNSHWTHELWDQVMAELETSPELIVLDEDSADDAAAEKLAHLNSDASDFDSGEETQAYPEHHSFRDPEPWEVRYTQKLDTETKYQQDEHSQWDQ